MKLNIVATDQKAENEGVWVTYPHNEEIQIKIVRFNSKPVQKKFEQLYKLNRKALRSKKAQLEVMHQVIAENVLKDWKGLEMEDGKPFKHSLENAKKLVSEEAYHDFVDWIIEESQNMYNFSEDTLTEVAEDVKK